MSYHWYKVQKLLTDEVISRGVAKDLSVLCTPNIPDHTKLPFVQYTNTLAKRSAPSLPGMTGDPHRILTLFKRYEVDS